MLPRGFEQTDGPADRTAAKRQQHQRAQADAVLASNQNIENNPMQSSMVSLAWML
jgi:hypothetical protein